MDATRFSVVEQGIIKLALEAYVESQRNEVERWGNNEESREFWTREAELAQSTLDKFSATLRGDLVAEFAQSGE